VSICWLELELADTTEQRSRQDRLHWSTWYVSSDNVSIPINKLTFRSILPLYLLLCFPKLQALGLEWTMQPSLVDRLHMHYLKHHFDLANKRYVRISRLRSTDKVALRRASITLAISCCTTYMSI
jgi:hypothetical protein